MPSLQCGQCITHFIVVCVGGSQAGICDDRIVPSAYANGMTAAYYWGSLPFIPIVIIVVFGLVASWAGAATRPAATGVAGSGRAAARTQIGYGCAGHSYGQVEGQGQDKDKEETKCTDLDKDSEKDKGNDKNGDGDKYTERCMDMDE